MTSTTSESSVFTPCFFGSYSAIIGRIGVLCNRARGVRVESERITRRRDDTRDGLARINQVGRNKRVISEHAADTFGRRPAFVIVSFGGERIGAGQFCIAEIIASLYTRTVVYWRVLSEWLSGFYDRVVDLIWAVTTL